MADSSHLEKMGTELKCPICLCIQKSMKEASSCPVCKIPFRRREVRSAPHMDNLVSIYRSMELASGMNIFVTQTAPPAKLSGAESQVEDVMVHRGEEDGETCRGTKKAQNKRRYKNKMSGQLNNNSQDFNLHPIRPSFPTKKRIRVPQHTPPATPTVDRKLEDGKCQHSENGAQRSLPEGKALLSDKGEPNFTPFFWLRDEEDAERSSEHTDEENLMDTQIDAPCFSDIKDSSDVNPYNGTAKGEQHIQKEDIFDSEMFEWTQRACSPELCPSQMEEQVNESNGCNITEEFEDGILHDSTDGSSRVWHADALSLKQGTDNVAVILPKVTLPTLVSSQMKKRNHVVATERPKKRARKARGCIHEKRVRKDAVEIGGACTSTKKGAAYGIQENCNKNGELLNLEENINRDTEQMAIKKTKSTSSVGMKVFTSSDEGNTINERNATMVFGASDLSDVKGGKNKSKNVTIIGKNSEKTTAQRQIYGDVTLSKSGRQTRKSGCKNNNNSNPGKKSDFSKRVRFSTDDNSQFVAGIQSTHGKSVSKELQPFEKVLRNACAIVEKEPSEVKNAPSRSNAMLLQKCQAVSSIQCAFCLSTEEHNKQLSGPMVHYLKGKPVAAIHNKSSGVIHAHRNCAEWAPNVYFDDDTAINLDAELARSRRIKCSLCGLKGAALGCYEKSCRKSFHFPCAKSMQQCRWDNENFVMLCPLHATLKLPNETCGPLQKEKQNHVPKRPSQMPVSQINKDGKSATPRWNSHVLFSKMVLCCSALTSMEKGTISEFEKLSGVAVVKTWDPRVTHVIASTDENGACRRTLKFLMGILEGKWILSIEWVKACMIIKDHVDEQQYEIGIDIHGIRDGARLGRMRLLNKQPKLFSGYSFYFTGDFVPSYKGYLHDLVVAAGGTVLHRKPISLDHEALSSGQINSKTLVVYSLEIPDKCSPSKKNTILSHRKSDAEILARPAGALAVSNLWILNSIASYKLQTLPE